MWLDCTTPLPLDPFLPVPILPSQFCCHWTSYIPLLFLYSSQKWDHLVFVCKLCKRCRLRASSRPHSGWPKAGVESRVQRLLKKKKAIHWSHCSETTRFIIREKYLNSHTINSIYLYWKLQQRERGPYWPGVRQHARSAHVTSVARGMWLIGKRDLCDQEEHRRLFLCDMPGVCSSSFPLAGEGRACPTGCLFSKTTFGRHERLPYWSDNFNEVQTYLWSALATFIFSFWFTLLNMTPSGTTHVVANVRFHIFYSLVVFHLCVYKLFIYLSAWIVSRF